MGKQSKILISDPILSKNFKYEKRSKNKLIQKAQTEEQKALQLKKKKELLEIEKKVDADIQKIGLNSLKLAKSNKVAELKKKMLEQNKKVEKSVAFNKSKVPEVTFSTVAKIEDIYKYHFSLEIKEADIIREVRKTQNQRIEEETKKEISQMFSYNNDFNGQKQAQQMQEENKQQLLNLSLECKRQAQVSMDSQLYQVTKNFQKHQNILVKKESLHNDKALDNAQIIIDNYFDHIFIENSQEEKIQNFRSIVINHCTNHLQRCSQDQKAKGFTNCKILIITPFMGDARAIIDLIEEKFVSYQFNNKEKLDQLEDQTDFFRIGIKIAQKKKQLTYFSNFDHSEIIIASPVGLKSIIGSEGDEKRQNSFISSVQIAYIDRASALLMQNWAHIPQIFSNMNIMPKYESLKNSFDLIRQSFLQLKGRLFRQTIVFSEFNFPQLNALKRFHFHNIQGGATSKVFYNKPISAQSKFEQNFYKIELKEPKDDLSMRFEYFKRKFWDDLHNKQSMTRVVLFVNSYFQYVKLKAFLQRVNASAEYICEHTSKSKVQSRLARFTLGQFRILLVTERAYYFEICQVKKFNSIYFYSLPKNSFIFQNLINGVEHTELGVNKIVSIYTKFDMLILERLVGTPKALEMVREYCNNVSFVI